MEIYIISIRFSDKLSRPSFVNFQPVHVINNHIPEKPAPVLRPSTCQARKIYNNVTLLGGMRAGNYTALGRATHLQDCIGRACDLNEGQYACYSKGFHAFFYRLFCLYIILRTLI